MPRLLALPPTRLDDWPELDKEAWQNARAPVSPFDRGPRRVRRWNEVTWNGIEMAYGQWLSWLFEAGALNHDKTPVNRADEHRVWEYVGAMRRWGLADYTIVGRIENLGRALAVMDPHADSSWVERGAGKLKSHAVRAKDVREQIRPAADLLALGHALMTSASSPCQNGGSYGSIRYRDGLLIAFLIHCPLRRRNLASLELGKHLRNVGGVWRIEIPPSETKSGAAISCAWPAALVEALECYLRDHRPVLRGRRPDRSETSGLWVSRQGRQMSSQAIYETVCERTAVAFGRPLTPHLFRHVAATEIATTAPDQALTIKMVLSHSSMGPSEKYYNRATALAAAERVQRSIDLMR